MTTGSKTTNLTTLVPTWDTLYPSGTVIPRGDYPVGFYWSKTWTGLDNPATPPASIFGAHWAKVDRESDGGVSAGRPRFTYRERWEMRRNRPRVRRPDNPYSATFYSWSDGLIQYRIRDFFPPQPTVQRSIRTFKQILGDGYSVTSGSWTGNDTIALQGKLRQKIVGSDFDMGVFLGEGRDALTLLTDSATRVTKALRAVKRGDVVSAMVALGLRAPRLKAPDSRKAVRDNVRNVAQRWLELQYGWLPIVQDAYGAAQALAQQLNNPAVQTYRVRLKKPLTATPTSSNIPNGGAWSFRGETRGQLIARLTEVDVATLNGLTDPSSVAWELLPWSFVADWFIPIGNYLSARGLSSALTGTFVTTITREERFTCSALWWNSLTTVEAFPPFRSWRYQLDRTVSTSLSTPKPSFKPLAEVFSWKRATNAVALLVTNFSSFASRRG